MIRSPIPRPKRTKVTSRAFEGVILAFALVVFLLVALTLVVLVRGSWASMVRYGLPFIVHQSWDPVHERFGALTFIFGSVVTSGLAILLSVGVSIGAAIFLTELAPRWLRTPLSFFIELLAAVPSVVYGLWGLLVLAPWLMDHVEVPLSNRFSGVPFLAGPVAQSNFFVAGVLLAIMVSPIITAVSRDVLRTVAGSQREGAIALGATRWEALWTVILPAARSGIVGAIVLGLGRALGETMAVTMVIGNRPQITASLFGSGYTLGSVLVNEFAEASSPIYLSSLIELGLLLFVVSVLMNACARLLVARTARSVSRR